jgi:hypothetical protein
VRSVYTIVYGIIGRMFFLFFLLVFSTKEKFASVGIKRNNVWSHDQGDRPNHVTKLPLGETR